LLTYNYIIIIIIVWHSTTTLIEANALPLSQTANRAFGTWTHSILVIGFNKRGRT